MTIKNRKRKILLVVFGVLFAYALWLTYRPVEIVAVHHRGNNFSAILVKNFPFTDRSKINWWLENRDILKEKYNVPDPDENGPFSIIVWRFGKGYQADKQDDDQYCFKDMQIREHCIQKDTLLIIDGRGKNQAYFTGDNGKYLLKNNGEIIKIKDR
ncbi:DUF943 family protein [Mixta gaviniae]|uniref:DUF943 domain-containing protein n=1 Tax=Mixta gaviniae TaxID=665914 RepID=A0A2L0IG55_9GAMM|nr:DUF943 family protein [Mixta gaviniae]AUX93557.1 hypothetical protein C2E15_11035 [Mixta gaviniae]